MTATGDPVGEVVGADAELLADDLREREARFARHAGDAVAKMHAAVSKVEADLRAVASDWPERVARLEGELPKLLARVSAAQEDARLARESTKEETAKRLGVEAALGGVREELRRAEAETATAVQRAAAALTEVASLQEAVEDLADERDGLREQVEHLTTELDVLKEETARPRLALPIGELINVTGSVSTLLTGLTVSAAIPSDQVDTESTSGAYAVGDWVFLLDLEGAMYPEDGIEHEFDPPITLAEADRFAAEHPRVLSIAAVLLGVEDPASVRVVGKCSLYATEEAAVDAQRRFGGERRRFPAPVSVEEAVEWCESDLAAVLASGVSAADWLLEVRGLRLADNRPAGGKLWLFDGPPGGPGEMTDNLSSAVLSLRASSFRVKQGSHRKYGPSYFFESSSRDPNE